MAPTEREFTAESPPAFKQRVSIHAGLFNGRTGVVHEVDTPNKMVRVHAPGMLSNETVLLRWDQVRPAMQRR